MNYTEQSDFAEKRKYIADLFETLRPFETKVDDWRSLEIGGAGGLLAGLLADHFVSVIATDVVNSQVEYAGNLLPLLGEKFERNAETFPFGKVEFLAADAQQLPFRDSWFDFCYSQNAFEHIPNPELALRELFRVTRPGGYIYLMFDPIWTADSGSHFIDYIGEPWAHLLESDLQIEQRMSSAQATADEISSYCHHMNRLPLAYYREMFPRVTSELGAAILIQHEWSGCVDESHLNHPNLAKAAAAIGAPQEDLLVRGMRLLLKA